MGGNIYMTKVNSDIRACGDLASKKLSHTLPWRLASVDLRRESPTANLSLVTKSSRLIFLAYIRFPQVRKTGKEKWKRIEKSVSNMHTWNNSKLERTRFIFCSETLLEIAANNMEKGIQGDLGALKGFGPTFRSLSVGSFIKAWSDTLV